MHVFDSGPLRKAAVAAAIHSDLTVTPSLLADPVDNVATDLQRDVLLTAGVDNRHLFEDHASGAKDDRPGLVKAWHSCNLETCITPKIPSVQKCLPMSPV
jgi:hypothetical protein